MEASSDFRPKVAEVVSQALVDENFRRQLREDRDAVASEYGLSDEDRKVLAEIPDAMLDQAAQEFRQGSVVGAVMAHFGGRWGTTAGPGS